MLGDSSILLFRLSTQIFQRSVKLHNSNAMRVVVYVGSIGGFQYPYISLHVDLRHRF